MTLPSTAGSALRSAALSLHGLEVEDRDWILRALPSEQSSMLRDLLRELQDLGIPAHEPLMQHRARQSASEARQALPPLTPAAAKDLARFLVAEPPRIRVVLLDAHPATWGDCLRTPGGDETSMRPQFAENSPGAPSAPALQEAVVAAVRHRLTAVEGSPRRRLVWEKVASYFAKRGAV